MTAPEVFRMVAAEFADVPDDVVQRWLTLTKPQVSSKHFGATYGQALAYLTAHRMKMAGLGEAAMGSIGDSLRVSSYSEGDSSVSFSANQAASLQSDGALALTPYGLEYLALRRSAAVPILSAGEA